jgi:hypothetical protein
MTRLTFLRQVGRPVAILFPLLAAVESWDSAAWGGPLANAIGTLLFYALRPLALLRAILRATAPAGAGSLLLPAIAVQGLYAVFVALGLRFQDGFEAGPVSRFSGLPDRSQRGDGGAAVS